MCSAGCWGRWCCRRCLCWFPLFPLVRVLWRPFLVFVAVLVWVSQFLVPGLGVVGWLLLAVGARHSWLRAWWVHLCVLAVFLATLQLPWWGVAGLLGFRVLRAFVVRAVLVLWCVVCVCGARVGGGCGGVCCVHAGACVRCVGGAFGCLSSPFWAWFGGSVWVWGLCVVAPLSSQLWSFGVGPRPPWLGSVGGVSPRRPLCVPSPLCLFAASPGAVLPWCRARAFPAVVGGGGSLSSARVPSPGVSPWGGRCLHSPSGCNSVVRAVHLYPLGTNGPAP